MKTLKRLENSKIFWYIFGISLIFFILRLPSLIEPNWYGDEGIYQVIGQSLAKGNLLYVQIWDNKPPLLYLVYAIFAGDQFLVRLFSLTTGLLTVCSFFYLSQLLFKKPLVSLFTTLFFAILFGTPLLEGNIANAENFILLPIIVSGYLVYRISSSTKNGKFLILNSKFLILFVAGLLLGIGFLFKIVAVFDFVAFFLFYLFVRLKDSKIVINNLWSPRRRFQSILPDLGYLFLGFLSPILITFLYFIYKDALMPFVQAVFISNVGYVGYGNKLIIPQGFLMLKLALLATVVIALFWKRKQISLTTLFISLWIPFSLFNTFFSNRPYTHYTLVSLPVFCLLIGSIISANNQKSKLFFFIILLGGLILITSTFKPNYKKSLNYYENAISFLSGNKSTESYQSFFDSKTPRDYELASFIKTHTTPTDKIFIWGDSAQIYTLSRKQPIVKYTVRYHITQYSHALQDTLYAINTFKPKYIITLNESEPIPFYLPTYMNKFVFKNALVYERTF